ncbi:hypothetical protein AKJ16_DCAP23528 [Drosera capensis]
MEEAISTLGEDYDFPWESGVDGTMRRGDLGRSRFSIPATFTSMDQELGFICFNQVKNLSSPTSDRAQRLAQTHPPAAEPP